jgi:hypothetical protein
VPPPLLLFTDSEFDPVAIYTFSEENGSDEIDPVIWKE